MRTPLALCLLAISVAANAAPVAHFPADNAKGINPDTHFILTFPATPTPGRSGHISIYDAANHSLVDTLDLSIPGGPDPAHRVVVPSAQTIDPNPPTPTTTTPAVKTTPADLHNYQLNTIGGLPDFHFYPVIVHGNTATIYPHNNVFHYGHTYTVEIDANAFAETPALKWAFTTKAKPPSPASTRLTIAADGSGDFSTVQGAVDFVPDAPTRRITLFIKNGTYEEIVFFQKKSNLTFRGEDREKVQIGYGNNSAFNPPMPGPSRRCAFSVYDSTGIELVNLSLNNYAYGQAEGLLVFGSKNIVDHVTIKGSGDALNLRGSVYFNESTTIGDGDTILGVGPAFFNHVEVHSKGPFMWIRNTAGNHGNVFLNSTFIADERPLPWAQTGAAAATAPARVPLAAVLARLPNNHGLNYPYAEAVLIHCKLKGISPAGWGPLEAEPANLHFWEYESTDLEGKPVDVSQRLPITKQLKTPEDANTITDYSNPSFVLGGWTPKLAE